MVPALQGEGTSHDNIIDNKAMVVYELMIHSQQCSFNVKTTNKYGMCRLITLPPTHDFSAMLMYRSAVII